MLAPGRPFQPSLIFVDDASAYSRVTRLGWKDLPGTNTPGRPFQPSLIFVDDTSAYSRVELLKCASFGEAPALHTRLGWKDLLGQTRQLIRNVCKLRL